MTDKDKIDHARGWMFVEKLMANGETAGGPRGFPRDSATWMPLAAAAAFLLLIVGLERKEIAAWINHSKDDGQAHVIHDHDKTRDPDNGQVLSPHERAEAMRDEAMAACDRLFWGVCGEKLDQARDLDPAGERSARVEKARAAIASHVLPDANLEDKSKREK